MYHNAVLLKESVNGLAIKPEGIYIDTTYGGGGHSKEILKRISTGRVIAFDQDDDTLKNRIDDDRFLLINHNFRYLKNFLKLHKCIPVDGILCDLGISSHQIDTPERGFSTRLDGPLDARMDNNIKLTSKEILNTYPKEKLQSIFSKYGEIKNAKKLASTIVAARKENELKTNFQFKDIISSCAKKGIENKYFAQVFQALRIEVNDEIKALEDMLLQTVDLIKPGGRLVVISYHSLEDRPVKNIMRTGNLKGHLEKDFYGNSKVPFNMITKKPIIPGEEEIKSNSRARSAKLRIAEKKQYD